MAGGTHTLDGFLATHQETNWGGRGLGGWCTTWFYLIQLFLGFFGHK